MKSKKQKKNEERRMKNEERKTKNEGINSIKINERHYSTKHILFFHFYRTLEDLN
jgi:hypothetical protein